MASETIYQSIILKKQPYGEADEIITLFTREAGKLRALAKSSKFSKSKLQYALQSLFLVNVTLAGSGLSKIIGTELVHAFPKIRENYQTAALGLYAEELLMKFTADEQPNSELFDLTHRFLEFLNSPGDEQVLGLGLAKYKIDFLDALGIGVHMVSQDSDVYFSNSKGGFTTENSADAFPVRPELITLFIKLQQSSFKGLQMSSPEDEKELQELLSGFLRYQLERDIKAERLLGDVV